MNSYRCYFLDAGGTIRDIAAVLAEHDAMAIIVARTLLADRPWSCGFELWHRMRRVVVEPASMSADALLAS
jgi:hypothetical protein